MPSLGEGFFFLNNPLLGVEEEDSLPTGRVVGGKGGNIRGLVLVLALTPNPPSGLGGRNVTPGAEAGHHVPGLP